MKKSKVIQTLTVLVLVAVVMCFSMVYGLIGFRNLLVSDSFQSRKIELDMISTAIAHSVNNANNWEIDDFENLLQVIVEDLDRHRFYVQLFDEELNSLSVRNSLFGNEVFDPRRNDAFNQIIREKDEGSIVIHTADISVTAPHDVHIYFKWITIDQRASQLRLIVIGVSEYTIDPEINPELLLSVLMVIPVVLGLVVHNTVLTYRLERKGRERHD